MLKKSYRLSTTHFMEVMEKGRIATSPLFLVRYIQNPASNKQILNHGGIAAVASKKIAPTAVLRNRLRRQMYEALAPIKDTIKPNTSLIIFAKKETIGANLSDMTNDLKQLFVKSKISV